MTITVRIESNRDAFKATLPGAPGVEAVAPSRSGAIDALRDEIKRRLASGELVELDLSPCGVSALADTFREDATQEPLCEDSYAERNRERELLAGGFTFLSEDEQADDAESVRQWIDDLNTIPPVPPPAEDPEWQAWENMMRRYDIEAVRQQFAGVKS